MKKLKMIVAASALFLAAGAASADSIAVITSVDGKGIGITKDEIANIYLGNSSTYGDGVQGQPVDHADGAQVRKKFFKTMLDKSEQDFDRHWSTRRFSGRGKPPRQLGSDAEVKQWVSSNPGSIGYINGKSMDKSVKLLLIIP
ncbi:MAG: hypothetical protein OEZ10_11980 [Gammaproteobacteria bacterium]|nr:hypothetical protein [Gammaproteobacteria bacterium]